MGGMLGPTQFHWIGVESNEDRCAICGSGMLGRSGNDCLMATMHAVKNSDCEKDRAGQTCEFRNRPEDFHHRSCDQAPRMRDTSGRLRSLLKTCSPGASLI